VETLPDDARARRMHPIAPPQPYLFVILEAERPWAGGSRHALGGIDEVRIGRGDVRAAQRTGGVLTLTLPDAFSSTQHARLTRHERGWQVEDLGSRNGLRVDGAMHQSGALADGSLLEVGHTFLTLRHQLEGAPAQPLDLDAAAPSSVPGLETLLPSLAREYAALAQVARAQVPILVGGATGTGKEVVARGVHAFSGRSGSFVAVNCGALPATLVESELFGVKKGAFSGATADRPGLRAADGGTLLLDEIGDLPLAAQVALLRVIQEREVLAVGDVRARPVDLRVVAASHQALPALVEAGRFRADLYARLAGFTLTLPPLRERREDLGLLTARLLARAQATTARLTPAAAALILTHDWPLNVRELEQRLTTALALAEPHQPCQPGQPGQIDRVHLQLPSEPVAKAHDDDDDADDDGTDQRTRLVALLTQHRGNVTEVARAVGRSRLQVYRWLRRHQLSPRSYR
jgi:transcriptional regulator with PAS, ATPase and Fis domain